MKITTTVDHLIAPRLVIANC